MAYDPLTSDALAKIVSDNSELDIYIRCEWAMCSDLAKADVFVEINNLRDSPTCALNPIIADLALKAYRDYFIATCIPWYDHDN